MNRDENQLLQMLDAAEDQALLAELAICEVKAGEVLYREAEPIDYVYFPLTCVAALFANFKDGNGASVGLIGYDGALGILPALSGLCATTRALVIVGGIANRIRRKRLKDLFYESDSARSLALRGVERLVLEAQAFAACNARHTVPARMARLILRTADYGDGCTASLTHEMLGRLMGVRRTTVTVIAGALQAEGLVRYSRGNIVIADRRELETTACDCFRNSVRQNLRPYSYHSLSEAGSAH